VPDRLLIRGARILDPANALDLPRGDVLIDAGRIAAVGRDLPAEGAEVIDAAGLVACPGFVDPHTHLREPGYEYKENVETGTQAAARGGYTTVCAMPNTDPPIDSKSVVEYLLRRAAESGAVRVLPIGCVTRGRAGKLLAELGELAEAGCIGFSDDGSPVADAAIMRRALEYASAFGLPVIDHCEDPSLAGGSMHEGWVSTRLGLKGIPAASEVTMIARDLALARETGAHVHIAHISTAGGVELVRRAKAEGIHVTAEVTPHHLSLTHEAVLHPPGGSGVLYDTNAKMYPPLREAEDVAACIEGLRDGTIDAVATDHAPHAVQEKLCEFDLAAFGITMLETAFGLAMTAVDAGLLSLPRLVEALTSGPVRAFRLDRRLAGIGTLSPGAPADIALLDPAAEWTVDTQQFASRGKNTPLGGQRLRGRVAATIYAGQLVHRLEGVAR
jgi:dihydroorotase